MAQLELASTLFHMQTNNVRKLWSRGPQNLGPWHQNICWTL